MSLSPDKESAHDPPTRRVLVVDDEPTLRLGFSYALSSRSTSVDTAATGRQALEKMDGTPYDILILDLRMPDIDGLAVIETLRQAGNSIPIVLCSAAITPAAVIRAIRHQVSDFLVKPVRLTDLREIVDYVLAPPATAVSLAMAAIRTGNIPAALEHARSAPVGDHDAAIWVEVLESILQPREEEPSPTEERFIRFSLSTLAFRSTLPPA